MTRRRSLLRGWQGDGIQHIKMELGYRKRRKGKMLNKPVQIKNQGLWEIESEKTANWEPVARSNKLSERSELSGDVEKQNEGKRGGEGNRCQCGKYRRKETENDSGTTKEKLREWGNWQLLGELDIQKRGRIRGKGNWHKDLKLRAARFIKALKTTRGLEMGSWKTEGNENYMKIEVQNDEEEAKETAANMQKERHARGTKRLNTTSGKEARSWENKWKLFI